jgi:hypothetical protein
MKSFVKMCREVAYVPKKFMEGLISQALVSVLFSLKITSTG